MVVNSLVFKNMINRVINTLFAIVFFAFLGHSQVLKLEGIYQGKNLYVQNPSVGKGTYCITDVKVNGTSSNDQIKSNAFEINLTVFDFKIGEKVEIELFHQKDCVPKIVNPHVLDPKSSFTLTTMKVDLKTAKLTFTTSGESGSIPFVVEQLRWNKWIKVAEIQGIGSSVVNTYQVQVNMASGENQFRVSQTDYSKTARISKVFKFRSLSPPVTYTPVKKITNEIIFSDVTMYEIYDPYGSLKLKGIGSKVDISSLPKLSKYKYILLFDNQELQFVKE